MKKQETKSTEVVEFQNQPKLKYGYELGFYDELNNDVNILNLKIKNLANNFISIGYYLNKIKENKYFDVLGFKDIYEFAESTYKFSKTSVKNFIAVANRFGQLTEFSGYKLKSKYENYNFSQLVELLPEDESNLDKYSPEQSIKEMRLTKFSKNIENDYNKVFDWIKKDLIEHLKVTFKNCKILFYDPNSFYNFLYITYKEYDLNFHFHKKELLLNIDCFQLKKSFIKQQILSLKLIDQTVNQFIKKVDAEIKEKETEEKEKSDVGPSEEVKNETVEVEVVDSSEDIKVQALKNNKQREEYIDNDSSYILVDYLSNSFIEVYELIDTPFIKIKVLCNDYNYSNNKTLTPKFITLGFYKLSDNEALSSLISYNKSSIIEWLRDNKI